MPRVLAGALLTALGAGGAVATVVCVYSQDEHYRPLFSLGMPGDLLFALFSLVLMLAGLALVFGRRRNGAGG